MLILWQGIFGRAPLYFFCGSCYWIWCYVLSSKGVFSGPYIFNTCTLLALIHLVWGCPLTNNRTKPNETNANGQNIAKTLYNLIIILGLICSIHVHFWHYYIWCWAAHSQLTIGQNQIKPLWIVQILQKYKIIEEYWHRGENRL